MVVGDVPLIEIASAIRPLQYQISQEINPIVYARGEFSDRMIRGQHFVTTVMQHPKLFLIGAEHELAAVAGNYKSTKLASTSAVQNNAGCEARIGLYHPFRNAGAVPTSQRTKVSFV